MHSRAYLTMKTNQTTNQCNLSKGLKAGDHSFYEKLFAEFYSKYFNYALSLSKDSQQSKDLVQDALTKLWINRSKINTQKNIHSYIFQIIKNDFVNNYTRKLRYNNLLDQLKNDVINEISEENNFVIDKLQSINFEIEKLPEKSKKIFKLNKKRGLCYEEISELLKISEKTVESHIYRALKRLRAELG